MTRDIGRFRQAESILPCRCGNGVSRYPVTASKARGDAMPTKKRTRQGLYLRVVDETRRPLNAVTTVRLHPVHGTDPAYTASSKPGMVVEYLLDVPRGDYDLTIAARDYIPHRSRISVGVDRTQTITVSLDRKGTARTRQCRRACPRLAFGHPGIPGEARCPRRAAESDRQEAAHVSTSRPAAASEQSEMDCPRTAQHQRARPSAGRTSNRRRNHLRGQR